MPIWETPTDWDNNQSQTGTENDAVSNTDRTDDSVMKKTYDYAGNPYAFDHWWPMHESSAPVHDVVGTADTVNTRGAPAFDVSGLLGATAVDFDGSDDGLEFGSNVAPGNLPMTIGCWVRHERLTSGGSNPTGDDQVAMRKGTEYLIQLNYADDLFRFFVDQGAVDIKSNSSPSVDTWYFLVGTIDTSGNAAFYVGSESDSSTTEVGTDSIGGVSSSSDVLTLGIRSQNNAYDKVMAGKICEAFYGQMHLAKSDVDALFDIVTTDGSFTTSVKSS